jgi:hypothetical protein
MGNEVGGTRVQNSIFETKQATVANSRAITIREKTKGEGKHGQVSFLKPPPPHDDIYVDNGSEKKEKVIVTIKMTGDRSSDFTAAFNKAEAMGLLTKRNRPDGYTWHHEPNLSEDGETAMVLIVSETHDAHIPHEGSVAQFCRMSGLEYGTYEAKMYAYNNGYITKLPKKRS